MKILPSHKNAAFELTFSWKSQVFPQQWNFLDVLMFALFFQEDMLELICYILSNLQKVLELQNHAA